MLEKTKKAIERYKTAAEEIGWEFLRKSDVRGKVFIKHSTCGKDQEVNTSNIVAGTVKCKYCQLSGYAKDAERKGWDWIGMNDHTYSRYRHHCGHEQIIQMASMNKQKPVCDKCQNSKLAMEASAIGWTFIRKVDKSYGEYLHDDCGSIRNLQPVHVRKGVARCEHCFINEKITSALASGFEFIKAISGHIGEYKHSCGAVSRFQYTHMRLGSVKCKHCYDSSIAGDAEDTQWEWIGRSGSGTSSYRHVCGYVQSIPHSKFRGNANGAVCHSCESNWYDKASNIYVLLFSSVNGQVLKVGFAKSHEQRLYTFKLSQGVDCEMLFSTPVKSGREAILKEKEIHRKLRDIRLSPEIGKMYVSSGFTEMYPVDKLQEIKDVVTDHCRE